MGIFKKGWNKFKSVVKKIDSDDVTKALSLVSDITSKRVDIMEYVESLVRGNYHQNFDNIQDLVFRKYKVLIPEETKNIIDQMITEAFLGEHSKFYDKEKKRVLFGVLKNNFVDECIKILAKDKNHYDLKDIIIKLSLEVLPILIKFFVSRNS